MPFVSICLLTYKRAGFLARSIDSLLAQTHVDFELIINDDNSPDNTAEICRQYEQRDRRVRYFRNETNLRYAGNQNAAVARAQSDYVAIVHDGDVYRPDLVEQWVKALHAEPTAAIVFNALEEMDGQGAVVKVHRHPYGSLIEGRDLLREMLTRPDSPIFGIVMVRRSHVLTVGPFDTTLPTLADIDMWMRLLARFDAAYVAEPLIRIAGRETDHRNRIGNWTIRREHERIHIRNLARLCESTPAGAGDYGRRVWLMLWRVRLHWLGWAILRGQFASFIAGMAYCFQNRHLDAIDQIDSNG